MIFRGKFGVYSICSRASDTSLQTKWCAISNFYSSNGRGNWIGGSVVLYSGNPDAAVFRFVFAVEMNNDTGQSFDYVGVACGAAVIRAGTDAFDDLHDFLFSRVIITANQNITEG